MSKALDVLLELKDCSDYWSEYFVPLGIHERIDDAIKELLAQPEQKPLSASTIVKLYTDSTGFEVHTGGWRNKILDFAEAIEKAHGIGEDDE